MAGNPWRRAPSGRIILADLVKNKLESDAPRAIASGFFEANTADAGTTRMIPLSGKLYTQPQYPVEIDWSNPLTRGFLKAFIPSTSKAILKGSAPSYLLKPSVTGIGYSGKRTVAYWEASPTALISGNPTWSIVLSVVSADVGIAGGLGLYCERPNATQIVKIAGSAGGSGVAEFVCRDASGNLAIITSSKVVNDGKPHVLAFTRVASNSHIGYVDGINVGASSTNVNGSFGATDAVIGADKANDSADFNGAIPLVSLWNRALSATEIKSLSDNPWQIFKSQSRRIFAAGTSSGSTGTVAVTNANDTSSASGATTVTGSVARTNANDTSSASGTTTILGTSSVTNAADTSSASGTTTITGTSATTNANDTSSASGTTTVTGTSATTNANDTSSASGSVGNNVTGTVATTNANDTSAASGTTTVTGTVAKTNANDTSAASGTTTVVGTLATTNANDTVSASGSVGNSITGTVAVTNSNDTLAASGTTTVTGALAKTNANDTSTASGTTTVTGALARTNANDTSSATGTTTITGALARTNANDTVSASGVTGAITGTVNYTNANDTSTGGNLASSSRLGGFEYGSKVYIKRGKKIVIFDSIEEADSYIEAEAKAEEIVQQSAKTSRLARKRAREKAFKMLAIDPVESVDIPALKTLVSQLQTDFALPHWIAQQDWGKVVEIYHQAMEMQDEEDLLLIL